MMGRRRNRFIIVIGVFVLGLGAWFSLSLLAAETAGPVLSLSKRPMQAVSTPAATEITVLYDGSLGNLPGEQGFDYLAFPPGPTQTISDGGAILDTLGSSSYQAGYFGRQSLMPTLDRSAGFTVTFAARLLAETHSTEHRAGFSLIVLGDDNGGAEAVQGIELAFWTDEVWAQDDDLQGGTLFTHAEGVSFDTTATTLYELVIITDTYTLSANGVVILNGRIRNYTNFNGLPDPYETPNFLFLGDDTSSAAARVKLNYVALVTPAAARFFYLPLIQQSPPASRRPTSPPAYPCHRHPGQRH